MRSFRTIGLAIAGVLGSCMGVMSRLVEPMLYFIAAGCDALACGVAKLKRELVHQFGEDVHHATGVGAGLDREGHGFRQHSATAIGLDERTAFA